MLSVAAGFGQDRYDSGAEVLVDVNRGVLDATYGPVGVARELTRTTYFVDASVNLALLKFALELGRVQGGDIDTYNRFSGKRADDALTYASLGVRLGF